MSRFKRLLARLKRCERGSAVTELALAAPMFLGLLAGTVELGNYLLLNLKAQHAAVAVADLATRDDELSEATLLDIFEAIPSIMDPLPVGDTSRIIVSAISKAENEDPRIVWQRAGGGSFSAASQVGAEGQTISLPAGLSILDNETIIMAEFFYNYEPLTFDVIDQQVIVKTSYFRPRLGSLQNID